MNNLTKNEYAIRQAFDELEVFFKEKDLGYYGYFKAVQGDILHDLYKQLDGMTDECYENWNINEMVKLLTTSIFLQKYNPLHNLIANTQFSCGGALIPYVRSPLLKDSDDEGTKWDIQAFGVLVD